MLKPAYFINLYNVYIPTYCSTKIRFVLLIISRRLINAEVMKVHHKQLWWHGDTKLMQ